MKNGVEKIISSILKGILNEVDAPEEAPFGKYLWADADGPNAGHPRISNNIRIDGAEEKNTEAENEFFRAFFHWVEGMPGGPAELEKVLKNTIDPMAGSGYYEKYLSPPKQLVYRSMVIPTKEAASMLGISEEIFWAEELTYKNLAVELFLRRMQI